MSEILSISTEEAQMLCRKVLLTTGLTKSAAEKITNILLQNEFDGYPSHGIMRVHDYVMDIRDGKVYPHSTINIQKENDYFTTITADKNLGIYVLSTLEDLLKNDTFGNIHFVAIKNSHH